MAVNLSPIGGVAGQFFDNNGNPLSGGKIFTYAAGTTTNQATYTSATGVTAHTNPIILDAAGRVPGGEIWLTDGLSYKFVIKTSTDVLIGTYDNIVGINSNFINFLTETEIQIATAGQTVFTLTTMDYQPGTNSLSVFVDGVNQYDGVTYAYVETDSVTVTFTAGLHVGALVKFTTAQTLSSGVTDASLVTYDPPFTGAVPTTVQAKLRETVSVKDFGAVGDGVADDTVAIQAALDTGKNVYLPSGTYKTTSSLDVTVSSTGLFGEGQSSIIEPDFVSGDVFVIGDGTNPIYGLNFSNFLVWPSVVKNSGYVFNNRFVQNSRWDNVFLGSLTVYVSHRLYDGYYFDRFGECTIAGGQIIVAETGVKARGNADGSFGYELNLGDDVRILYATKGVWIGGGCGGIYFDRMDASECTNGLYFDATLQSGVANREIFLDPGCTIDSCTEWGIIFKINGGNLVQVNGLWVASNGTALATAGGILIESAGSFSWSNLICFNNAYDGISIADGSHSFTGGFIRNNGAGASGGHGVFTSGFSRLIATGVTFSSNGDITRGYGLYLDAAANNYIVEANTFFSNGQDAIFDTNATLTQIVRDNAGYVTENSSYAQVLAGNSTVIVNHGLSGVPTLVEVGFAGAMDSTSVFVYVAPSSFTSTQFTITYSTTASVNRDFWWRATRGQA